jgi:CBS domain containing-hemolysin-like protein
MTSDSSEPGSSRFRDLLISLSKNPFTRKKPVNGINLSHLEMMTATQNDMVKGVLKLANQNARDIMIPRVDIRAVDSRTDLRTLVRFVVDAGHSRLPVYEETIDNVIGILYAKDLLPILVEKPKKFQIKKYLHEPFFVPETMPLEELLREFRMRKLHLAIVVDEYGGISGIVTLEDVLEEIVGEIHDEYDTEALPEIIRMGKNSWEVDSRMPLVDFNEKLGLNLPTDDFDTVGGMVFDLFGKIPERDEMIRHGRLTFKIKDITGTVINRIQVTLARK